MIALRLLSLLAGAVVLILPSVLLASAGMSGTAVVAALLGVALVSASFIYVALAGDRMRRSAGARMLGAILLAVPIVCSLVLMASRKEPELLWSSGALLAFSVVLFLSFVFPVIERRQRPMRQRERLV